MYRRDVHAHLPTARHAWLYALPCVHLPRSVACHGERYEHVRTFKHDFFAATGLYRGPQGLCVLKLGRFNPILGVPTAWIGRFLRWQEERTYAILGDMAGLPRYVGRVGTTGFLHTFVPGRVLQKGDRVNDLFFDQLAALLRSMHERGVAYVDLNKPQNILLGDDGRPYLIDFQISLRCPRPSPFLPWRYALRWVWSLFCDADGYHLLKHKRRLRPDLLTEPERDAAGGVGFWIQAHRLIARPLTHLRRRLLTRLSRSETVDVAGSAAK